jgi:hypothetical protein
MNMTYVFLLTRDSSFCPNQIHMWNLGTGAGSFFGESFVGRVIYREVNSAAMNLVAEGFSWNAPFIRLKTTMLSLVQQKSLLFCIVSISKGDLLAKIEKQSLPGDHFVDHGISVPRHIYASSIGVL